VPLAIAGNSVLAAAALAAQAHANVQTLGWERPLSLYVLTIAASGDRKTSADEVALAPMHAYRRHLTQVYRDALREHERQVEENKAARQKARGASEGGATAPEVPDDPPLPRKPKLFCSELNAATLALSFAHGQYSQGMYSDEGGKFLGGYAMSDDALKSTIAALCDIWQGKPLDRNRCAARWRLMAALTTPRRPLARVAAQEPP
jgi:Protein of unknown function (DUF3987)